MKKLIITVIMIPFVITSMNKVSAQEIGILIDSRDGKTYKIVTIREQVWMAENLAFRSDSGCVVYDDDQSNLSQYGYLYNFETAKNVCPDDYHLPTKTEFETLLNNYGGASDQKANYAALLPSGNSGFSALLGGYISEPAGIFHNKDISTEFWSVSASNNDEAWHLFIYSQNLKAGLDYYSKSNGFSVRCLKDAVSK